MIVTFNGDKRKMVSNEELVYLYRETTNKVNKEILFKKLYSRLKGGVAKIYNFYAKLLKIKAEDYMEEAEQEAMICLLKCIDKYDESKGTRFITFYYNCVGNQLSVLYKNTFSQTINEVSDTEEVECKSGDMIDIEQKVDNFKLYDILNSEVKNIKFQKEVHKKIFLDWIGFNEDRIDDENFASLGRKYKLSRMAVKKICNKYYDILLDYINSSNSLEKMRSFL